MPPNVLRWRHVVLCAALLAAPRPAAATDDAAQVSTARPGVRPAPGATDGATDLRALEGEGIWAWVERFDGEVPDDRLQRGIDEQVEAELLERALVEGLDGLDVPVDYYDDPERVLTGDPLQLEGLDLAAFDLPVELNEHVKKWMRLLLGPYRRYLHTWIERKAAFEPMIQAELAEAGLPGELIYLSMIESGFNPHAYSHAHAAGLWQFIPSTGRMYGLKVDFWLDERRDPVLSTRAALRMLSDLHRQFGDWYLAFAAYNTGPGRVRRALASLEAEGMEPGTATYWTLVERELIHRETRGYVPKLLAAAILTEHAARYGFTDLEPEPVWEADPVEIDGAVDVDVLARCAGLDEDAFRALNPALRRYATPEGVSRLWVPTGTGEAFLAALAEVPPEARRRIVLHKVAPGESLSGIASSYGVSTASVVEANRIRNPNRLAVGQKLIIPIRGEVPEPAVAERTEEAPASYVVRSGDTLSAIAVRFGLSEADLRAFNGIRDARGLQVGQRLVLRAPAATPAPAGKPAPAAPASSSAAKPATYTVRPGDALSVIAERLGVPMAELMAANGLRDASKIGIGQVLKVPGGGGPAPAPSGTPERYTVVAGDALSTIAERFKVDARDLARWNGITDPSSLRVGQEIALRGGTASRVEPADPVRYTVRSGDALSVIAERHGVSMKAIMAENGLRDASTLRIGQVLKIPVASGGWSSHTVASGESLGIIARRYGVSVDDLKSWNQLRNATIFPGDVLRIRVK